MRATWVVLLCGLIWQGYTQTGIDYAADFGGFESDTRGDGVADGWSVWRNFGGSDPHPEVGLHFQLTQARAIEGRRSQEIRIARSSEQQAIFTISRTVIDPNLSAALYPPLGTPLLVRLWVQTENLENVTAYVVVITGQRSVVVRELPTTSQGWVPVSIVLPLEANAAGRPLFRVSVDFSLRAGAASGRVWIDGVQVLWTGFSLPMRPRPNLLKIAHYNLPPSHWQQLLDPPVDFLVNPLGSVLAIKSHLPRTMTGVYVNAAQTADWIPTSPYDMYGGYQFVLQNHPHWFLTRNGVPFNNPGYPDLWGVDIGLQEVRQQFVQRFLRLREQVPVPEWIFLDDTGAHWQCDQYPNLDSNQQAWTGFFEYVLSEIHRRTNRAHKFMMNSGSWAGRFVDGNEGTQWIQHLDGVMLEHIFTFYRRQNGGEYVYQPYRYNRTTLHKTDSTWWGALRAINAYPEKVWVLVPMCDAEENPSMFRYIIASYFIMAHSNTYLMVENRRNPGSQTYHKWINRPEPWVPIGQPTSRWYVLAGTDTNHTGALFARDFEYGIVLVNPTESQTYEYTLPRAYKNWDGQVLSAGTRLQIGPKTGVALYAAPEVVMSLSPQQVTALPGETVTFTVQYRNSGLVDAMNVKISVPLPEGLEFVSSSTGGQYLNRQVTWTLPLVRAGQSGTLTFQARVQ